MSVRSLRGFLFDAGFLITATGTCFLSVSSPNALAKSSAVASAAHHCESFDVVATTKEHQDNPGGTGGTPGAKPAAPAPKAKSKSKAKPASGEKPGGTGGTPGAKPAAPAPKTKPDEKPEPNSGEEPGGTGGTLGAATGYLDVSILKVRSEKIDDFRV